MEYREDTCSSFVKIIVLKQGQHRYQTYAGDKTPTMSTSMYRIMQTDKKEKKKNAITMRYAKITGIKG